MKQIQRFLKRKNVREILGDDYQITEIQQQRLLLILTDVRQVKALEDWLPCFAHFIRNDLTNYVGRFRRLRQLPACPSLYNLVLRYGKREALERLAENNRKRALNFPASNAYWTSRGYSEAEAQSKANAIRDEGRLKAMQVLRGSSEYTVRSLTYWLKLGYGLSDANEKVRQIQTTNGLNAYRRRGGIDPQHAQQDRNERWLATLAAKDAEERRRIDKARSHSIEGCLARGLTPTDAESTSISYYSKRRNFSKVSQVCFDMVADRIGRDRLYYKTLNHEKQFNAKNVDFFDGASGVVIEFLGDFWHANPITYKSHVMLYGKPACNIWAEDRARFELIEAHPGVSGLFKVWESEFRANPTDVVQAIVELLSEERHERRSSNGRKVA